MIPPAPGFGELPLFMLVVMGLFAVLFSTILVLIVRTAVRSRRVLRQHGIDPLAAEATIAARLARGPLGTPAQSLEQRLAELDDLHRRGVISSAEHEAARTAALTGP